jgi:hypothetical protein
MEIPDTIGRRRLRPVNPVGESVPLCAVESAGSTQQHQPLRQRPREHSRQSRKVFHSTVYSVSDGTHRTCTPSSQKKSYESGLLAESALSPAETQTEQFENL